MDSFIPKYEISPQIELVSDFFFSCQNTNTSLMINRKIMATMYNLKDESEINNGYNERRRTHDLPPQTLFFSSLF